MANIIDFKARGFKLSQDCDTNRGTRLIVTECGENVECFEIGQEGMMTTITRSVAIEPDHDYVFRFTVKSRFVKGENAESMASIYFDEKGDGYTYPLDRADKNRFKPVLCKKTEDGLLRVFELPFNSGDSSSCTIEISVHDMTAWLYPAKELSAYDSLEDIDYDQWRQDELHRVSKYISDLSGSMVETIGETLNGFGEFVGKAGDKISKAVSDVINRPAADAEAPEASGDAEASGDEAAKDVVVEAEATEAPASDNAAASDAAPAESNVDASAAATNDNATTANESDGI